MGIYEDIREHAPNTTFTSAGDLHEALWVALLRVGTPDLHNVRLARGDGGIDGIHFVDPLLGAAHIYQAKFYEKLDEGHRPEVVKAFVAAHGHDFPCAGWTLLVPFHLSAPELNWLTIELRAEAIKAAPDASKAVAACSIDYMDDDDLHDLLKANLSVAAKYLPRSVLALTAQLEEERKKRGAMEAEVVSRLREVQSGLVRDRRVQTRQSLAAVKMLNQGWEDQVGTLRSLTFAKRSPDEVLLIAKELVRFCETRMREAYAAEGLVPGASELVSYIDQRGRVLQLAVVFTQLTKDGAEIGVASDIIDRIKDLQGRIARAMEILFPAH